MLKHRVGQVRVVMSMTIMRVVRWVAKSLCLAMWSGILGGRDGWGEGAARATRSSASPTASWAVRGGDKIHRFGSRGPAGAAMTSSENQRRVLSP